MKASRNWTKKSSEVPVVPPETIGKVKFRSECSSFATRVHPRQDPHPVSCSHNNSFESSNAKGSPSYPCPLEIRLAWCNFPVEVACFICSSRLLLLYVLTMDVTVEFRLN